MSDDERLKPCPFCGGEAHLDFRTFLFSQPFDFFVKCAGCGIHTHDYVDKNKAITVWNRRVQS